VKRGAALRRRGILAAVVVAEAFVAVGHAGLVEGGDGLDVAVDEDEVVIGAVPGLAIEGDVGGVGHASIIGIVIAVVVSPGAFARQDHHGLVEHPGDLDGGRGKLHAVGITRSPRGEIIIAQGLGTLARGGGTSENLSIAPVVRIELFGPTGLTGIGAD